jgi:hypothetical protein
MPAVATGTKAVTKDLAPHLTATALTALLAKPIEQLTIRELATLADAIARVSRGHEPGITIGQLLT